MTYDEFISLSSTPDVILDRVYADELRRYHVAHKTYWQSTMGTNGVRYGSYKPFSRHQLKGRLYDLEYVDGTVGIRWRDQIYNHQLNKIHRFPTID